MKDIQILAIETSCDETAAAVVRNGREVLSNTIFSQIDLHTLYGGVVPEIASRKHMEKIDQVVAEALLRADRTLEEMDAIAVTYGPGLVGALLVGVAHAKGLAFALGRPLVGVHHIEGHIAANFIAHPELEPPFACLVVSGGHTHLVIVEDYGEYRLIGKTRDDAAGEAFDKVARAIGLGYPGGPKIDRVSGEGNPDALHFPRAKVAQSAYDFSFSGLKSAVLNYLNACRMKDIPICVPDVAASFQKAVTDVLVEHAMHAADEYGFDRLAIAGGVASNTALRSAMEKACMEKGIAFYCPPPILCTDNAAMIGSAAFYEYRKGNLADLTLNAVPGLKLGER
ncbi:MAG: tRNA (adenosine(37)-N6)-threonylcarbamoyltransferase complex transferase subunit TsaD [Lachnospiraceae bacterium]|nr:tRNA (adenosine(37)-N6)-threonylcarbamoyltransferase complex transferase subunit TsaD [Lachnospiraceae bacterium]